MASAGVIKTEPFTYLIGWTSLDKWYYGVRFGNGCATTDLWTKYFTSSKIVKEYRSLFGEPDHIEIRKTFKTPKEAQLWESRVLKRLKVNKKIKWLNVSDGRLKFASTAQRAAAIEVSTDKKLGMVSIFDPRWKTGEIVGCTTGISNGKLVSTGEIISTTSKDPRWKTGEIVGLTRGKALAKDFKTGEILGLVDRNDVRWKTGEIKAAVRGVLGAYLVKTGENIGFVSLDDLRWKTGEIESVRRKKASAKITSTGENIGQISLKDPRWKTGEIVGIGIKTATAKCAKTGIFLGRIDKSDPRWKTGEIVGPAANTKWAHTVDGKRWKRIDVNDPRWKTGELIDSKKRLQILANRI